jgi:molybdate transport system ATP-binding protein
MVAIVVGGLDARFVVVQSSGFRLALEVHVASGTTVALLGPNGAGKSTAVWALSGVIPVAEGVVSLAGRVLDDVAAGVRVVPEERRIGVVFQAVLLFPHLNVLENVAFGVRRNGAGHRGAVEAARGWLDHFGLGGLSGLRPSQLSGGQAQQVGLARALASEPDLLLLDEPLSALDVGTRAQVRRILGEHLRSFPGPRLLITHDPAEAFLLADRVVVIEDGRVTQTGTPDEIRRHPMTGYAADLAGVNLVTGTAGAGVVRVSDGPDLTILDTSVSGPVLLTIHPRAISIHPRPPEGSPRNTWLSTITSVEDLGDSCRIQFGAPLVVTSEVSSASRLELGLEAGREFWVAIKAAEVVVRPA